MSEPILRVDGLCAGYGGMRILNRLDLAVVPGRLTTIIGPNGAGKSTLFKTVFGLLPPDEGRICLDGADITGLAPRALLSRGLAYVPQGRNLFPELSVRHNLELGGVTLGDDALLWARMDAALDRFPILRERADRQASTLSGGEQKQLEIARALLLEPKLLLIDEPSIGLAPRLAAEVFDLLRALVDAGTTVLMIEQNARRALALSDDALVLDQGRLARAGPAATILADPAIGSLFLGGTGSLTDAAS